MRRARVWRRMTSEPCIARASATGAPDAGGAAAHGPSSPTTGARAEIRASVRRRRRSAVQLPLECGQGVRVAAVVLRHRGSLYLCLRCSLSTRHGCERRVHLNNCFIQSIDERHISSFMARFEVDHNNDSRAGLNHDIH